MAFISASMALRRQPANSGYSRPATRYRNPTSGSGYSGRVANTINTSIRDEASSKVNEADPSTVLSSNFGDYDSKVDPGPSNSSSSPSGGGNSHSQLAVVEVDSNVSSSAKRCGDAFATKPAKATKATKPWPGGPPQPGRRSPRKDLAQRRPNHAPVTHRNTSALRRYKTQEDVICNNVLWMALITHMGKQSRSADIGTKRSCVFGPQSLFRTYWDSISMVFIIYIIGFTPLQVAFMAPPMLETSLDKHHLWGQECASGTVPCGNYWGIFIMDLVIDLFFTADIVVNFRSAWVDTDPYSPTFKSVNYSCQEASCRYVKGMFVIDVISVFPFWIMDIMPKGSQSVKGSLLRVPRLLRLAKLIKLFRVLRASRVFSRWNKAITTTCSSSAAMLIELTVVLIVSVHFMGCLWFLIASLHIGYEEPFEDKYGVTPTSTTTPNVTAPSPFEPETEWWDGRTWILRVNDYQRNSLSEMYLAAIYFALATITTIGYGDIVPVIFVERVTAFMCMIIGVIVFAYVVGQVTVLISSCTTRRNLFFEDMSTLQAYLRSYPFSKATRNRAIDYFYYTYNNKQYNYDNEARMKTISHFSPFLQRNLAYAELKHFLVGWQQLSEHDLDFNSKGAEITYPDPLPFLSRASQHIIKDLCAELTCSVYGPIEIVAHQGGPCNEMYTLDQGCMCKWGCTYNHGLVELSGWKYLQKGARFGTDSLLLHLDRHTVTRTNTHVCTWSQSYQTLTFCDFIKLDANTFAEILRRYPKQVEHMRGAILRARFRAFCHSILHIPKDALVGMLNEVPRNRVDGRLTDVAQEVVQLRKENNELKDVVMQVQSELSEQRSEFEERMQDVMEDQRQILETHQKEILALLRSQRAGAGNA